MRGGAGNDTYVVDNAGDIVIEAAGGGTDLVQSSVTFTLGANVENLTLTGAPRSTAPATASPTSSPATPPPTSSNGGAGADTMAAALGNDTYVVDNAGDIVIEARRRAAPTRCRARVSLHARPPMSRTSTLTGAAAINGTGNALANILTGNCAAPTCSTAAAAPTR